MRSRYLLLAVMTSAIVACGPSETQTATPADDAHLADAPGTPPDSDIILRRISVSADDVDLFDAAPDGSFLTGVGNGSSGDVLVMNSRSREVRTVNPRDVNGVWGEFGWAEGALVSPDGERIAYVWLGETVVGRDDWHYQLRIMDIDGSNDRVLLDSGFFHEIAGWTDDGWVLTVDHPEPVALLRMVSERDGETRTLREMPSTNHMAAVSPDGSYAVFSLHGEQESGYDIYTHAIATGRETRVTQFPRDETVLGWVPGQDAILFYADQGIWRLELSEGEAVGLPELVQSDVQGRIDWLGLTSEGLMYEVGLQERGLFTVSLDLEAGRVVGPVTELARPAWGSPAWSPDSRFLAYGPGRQRINVRTIDSDEEREFPTLLRGINNLQWHPDGQSIFFHGSYASPTPRVASGLNKLDLSTEETNWVASAVARGKEWCLSPDGWTRYFRRTGPPGEGKNGIYAQDLETGDTRRIEGAEGRLRSRISVSPDGTMLAYRARLDERGRIAPEAGDEPLGSGIAVVPTAGGEARAIYRIPEGWRHGSWDGHYPWTPDGRHVLVAATSDTGLTIVKVPVEGGEPTTLLTYRPPDFQEDVYHLNLSPDGRHAAFILAGSRSEIWLLQGF